VRTFGGIVCSIVGTAAFIAGLAIAQSQSEVHILSTAESIGFGLAIAFGFALMIAGFRLARWGAIVVDGIVLGYFIFVVYPSVWTSRGRSLQTQTIANIRALATALEERASDTNEYPRVKTIDDLAPLLEPTYIKRIPRVDGWGNPLRYESWKQDAKSVGADHYAIGSAGRDHKFERASLRRYSKTSTTTFDGDLVFRDGEWISLPESLPQVADRSANPPPATSTDPKTLFDQATSLYRADRYNMAIPMFEHYLKSNPSDALANARLGMSLAQIGRLQESIPFLRKAIAADATDYQSCSNLGLVYEKLKRPEEGIEWQRKADAIHPNDPVVLNNLGWVLMQSGHNVEAVTVFQRAVRLAPNEKLYRENLAQARKNAALHLPF